MLHLLDVVPFDALEVSISAKGAFHRTLTIKCGSSFATTG
jgi:hypothetical protein